MRHTTFTLASVFLSLLLLTGCSAQQAPWVELKGQRYRVELATDDASRMRGLMFRDQLPDDQGMLFIFESTQPLAFWMRNTRIPLDIFYFDEAMQLISVAARVPPCTTPSCPSYPSKAPGRFVLELNAGHAQRLGVRAGDALTVSPEIQALLAR